MTGYFKAAALCAVMALGACSNNNGADDAGNAGLNGPGGIDSSELGSVNDPTSIAYFQQAVGDRVLFAVDQATISSEGQATLAAQAGWLNTNTDYIAVIEGHADEQGTREYNLALGARRAAAVREFLISRGVAGNRLKTVSYGKERPIEVCSTESCYSKNRRAVTVLSVSLPG